MDSVPNVMDPVQDTVLRYPKLKKWLAKRRDPASEKRKVLANLRELKMDLSRLAVKGAVGFLDTVLPIFYDNLYFHENGVDLDHMIKNHCTVFVPNHRSHADYIVLNYLLYKRYHIPICVAGGINLNMALLGRMFRGLGCFFIRRSFKTNVSYRLTLEAYLYYLLKNRYPVEFFFEGGRSRTGRMLPPKYGFYQMFSDAYLTLSQESDSSLFFIPISLSHEYIPDQKSFARELSGGKKVPESLSQTLGLFKLFAYKFGSIHVSLGQPIQWRPNGKEQSRQEIKELGPQCLKRIEKGIVITPSSILSLVILDSLKDTFEWVDFLAVARDVRQFCQDVGLPYATQELDGDRWEDSLRRAMNMMIRNGVIKAIKDGPQKEQTFYAPHESGRGQLVYLKNTVIHHFLTAWFLSLLLKELDQGQSQRTDQLKDFFLKKRRQLMAVFNLPAEEALMKDLLTLASILLKRDFHGMDDFFHLTSENRNMLTTRVNPFSELGRFVEESYYLVAKTLALLGRHHPEGFSLEAYQAKLKELSMEEKGGRIQCIEADLSSLFRFCREYYAQEEGLISCEKNFLKVCHPQGLDKILKMYENRLNRMSN